VPQEYIQYCAFADNQFVSRLLSDTAGIVALRFGLHLDFDRMLRTEMILALISGFKTDSTKFYNWI
jgi:hypothetical protein